MISTISFHVLISAPWTDLFSQKPIIKCLWQKQHYRIHTYTLTQGTLYNLLSLSWRRYQNLYIMTILCFLFRITEEKKESSVGASWKYMRKTFCFALISCLCTLCSSVICCILVKLWLEKFIHSSTTYNRMYKIRWSSWFIY